VSMEAIQTVVVKSIEAAPVEPTQINPSEPTHPEPSAAMPKMSARAKALDEKLRNLKERAKAAREAAGETVITTRKIGGSHESDFVMAARIDALASGPLDSAWLPPLPPPRRTKQ
jgi:hypothetical protein